MDAVTLDAGNRDDVWVALENLEYFSNPWIVIKMKNDKVTAMIFGNQESAKKYIMKLTSKRLSADVEIFCIKSEYKAS